MQAFDAILLMVEHKIRLAAQEGKGELTIPYQNGIGLTNCVYDVQSVLQRRGFEINIGGQNNSNGVWTPSLSIKWASQ